MSSYKLSVNYVQTSGITDNYLTVFEVLNFLARLSGPRSLRNSPIRLQNIYIRFSKIVTPHSKTVTITDVSENGQLKKIPGENRMELREEQMLLK
jgi:ABC-type multidrug transport system ATPase subunit